MTRILVTGSRRYGDELVVGAALCWVIGEHTGLTFISSTDEPRMGWAGVTVVHGAVPGLDTLAGRIAASWGVTVEEHPADWDRYGRAAGHRRNAGMVALGAGVVLGFPLGASPGTRGCVKMAGEAGIRVVDWPLEGERLMSAGGLRYGSVGGS